MKKTYVFLALIGILFSASFTRITVDHEPLTAPEEEVTTTVDEKDKGTAFNKSKANLLAIHP
ncbi:hypothetical protein [Arenibacter latericius]|uniref:hypothetical protein n=1 Tax=Arenibacter latericius TaxID=86104 RepID=UPI000409393D|nr:hypothetical protein [Arenibacter latericius]